MCLQYAWNFSSSAQPHEMALVSTLEVRKTDWRGSPAWGLQGAQRGLRAGGMSTEPTPGSWLHAGHTRVLPRHTQRSPGLWALPGDSGRYPATHGALRDSGHYPRTLGATPPHTALSRTLGATPLNNTSSLCSSNRYSHLQK